MRLLKTSNLIWRSIRYLYRNRDIQKEGLVGIGFADDVNLLSYAQSTEENCRKLKRTNKELLV